MNVLAVVDDLPVRRLEQASEHFDGGAFAGAVGAEVAENLSGLQRKGDVPHSKDGAVEFGESSGLEHRPSLRSGQTPRGAPDIGLTPRDGRSSRKEQDGRDATEKKREIRRSKRKTQGEKAKGAAVLRP